MSARPDLCLFAAALVSFGRAVTEASPSARPPEAGPASRETRLALVASKLTKVGLEPRHSLPSGDRSLYSASEGLTSS